MTRVLDLFAGPGGWDVAAASLGITPLGIEWDDNACATRKAAGLRTVQGDVAMLRPGDYGPVEGLIASPPCQSFSMAGKRGGEQDTEHVIACAHEIVAGNDSRAEHRARCEDARSMLVVEPLRWVRDLRPRWVALEQVPPVLGLWSLFAQLMQGWGYRTWTGVLSAERYGVPQTRKRAILLASLDFQPHPPEPTHQAYIAGQPQRHEVTMFGEVLPWVSMAQALGWDEGPSPSPSPSVTGGGGGTGGVEVFAGKSARERARDAVAFRAGTNDHDVERATTEPAPTIRYGERLNDVSWVMRGNSHCRQTGAQPRSTEDPAPTLAAQGLAKGRDVWITGQRRVAGESEQREPRGIDEPSYTLRANAGGGSEGVGRSGGIEWTTERPAPTIVGTRRSDEGMLVGRQLPDGEGRNVGGHGWTGERPSTTVNTTNGIAEPGHHGENSMSHNAIRVTIQEASILQSFPPDYPWQGARTAQFQQIGNAVPPLLAAAVLAQVVDARGGVS